MSKNDDEMILSVGAVRGRGEFFRNNIRPKGRSETFKNVSTGFSCGLGNEECELFKTRGGAAPRRVERFVPGGLHAAGGMGGAFVGNLGPRQFSGNAAADFSDASKVNLKAAEKARAARDLTSKSDQRMVGEARVQFGAAIGKKRAQQREGFMGKTMTLEKDEKKEMFANKSIADASLRIEKYGPVKRSHVSEQYMKKVSGSGKAGGFRSQYGF